MEGLSFDRFGALSAVCTARLRLDTRLRWSFICTVRPERRPTRTLNPKSPGLLTASVLVGFLLNPIWFVWLGLVLGRTSPLESARLGR